MKGYFGRGRIVTVKVFCKKCNEWVPETHVKILDLFEGPCGEDRVVFIHKMCGDRNTSLRVG